MKKIDQAFDELVMNIQSSIHADVTGSGFHAINCPMCKNKNQTQKKGGFKFEPDQVVYNCFIGSCDAATVYTSGERPSRKFRELMETLGVKIPIEILTAGKKRRGVLEKEDERFEKNIYKSLSFPEEFVTDIPDFWLGVLMDRMTIYYDLDFRYVTEGNYRGCLAVPHYFYDKLIGWDYLTKNGTYITAPESSESMLFIPSKIPPKRPLIVEGIHDALCFPNTIAVKHSKVSRKQAYHLRNSTPVVLPDRSGSKLYESAKEYGWEVCIPNWKEKDLNAVVKKRGILVAAKMIHDSTMKVGRKSEVLYKKWVINE